MTMMCCVTVTRGGDMLSTGEVLEMLTHEGVKLTELEDTVCSSS